MMNDQEVIRSRYSKGEIIEVIHGVATLMEARRKKAFFISETKKIQFQISFLEQQVDAIHDKLRQLDATIRKTEETAKVPADTLLDLRAARKTIISEHLRLQEIEKKSRQLVNGKNAARIATLTAEVDAYENQGLIGATEQLRHSQSRLAELRQQKSDSVATLEKLWAVYRHAFLDAQWLRHSAHEQMATLEAKSKALAVELTQQLTAEEQELSAELKVLEEQRTELARHNLELTHELTRLQATKSRIDKLDDPQAYMDQLREKLEEDKLSTEAKGDVLTAVTAIIKEVDDVNKSITDMIDEYRAEMCEFEHGLARLKG